MPRPESPSRPPHYRPPPADAPPAPRVGPQRIAKLTDMAVEQMDPSVLVRVVFEGEPLTARFLCNQCEGFLRTYKGESWACETCMYALHRPQARLIVTKSHHLLDELVADERPKDVGLAAPSPEAAPERWWQWLLRRISRSSPSAG